MAELSTFSCWAKSQKREATNAVTSPLGVVSGKNWLNMVIQGPLRLRGRKRKRRLISGMSEKRTGRKKVGSKREIGEHERGETKKNREMKAGEKGRSGKMQALILVRAGLTKGKARQ